MPTIIFSFPGKRYHATPWGHHVNEGLVEWPPCPWRLLRALIACGYAKHGWRTVPADGRELIETLSGTLPTYRLPPAIATHSRHYMPQAALAGGKEKTALVLDAWARVEGELAVIWDVSLSATATDLLGKLVENLNYLGRSESWVVARLAKDGEALPAGSEAVPHLDGTPPKEPGWEQVSLLAAMPTDNYTSWREEALTQAKEALQKALPQTPNKKDLTKFKKECKKLEAPYPVDLLSCLQVDTAWVKKHGWSQPPGSRQVLYWRRSDVFAGGGAVAARAANSLPAMEAVLLSISTQTGNAHALPAITRTLPQAELLHQSLVSKVNFYHSATASVELIGLDAASRPLQGHRHAHILPLDLNGDSHLDHYLIWAPMKLGDAAQKAIRAVRKTYMKGGAGELQVAFCGAGSLADFLRLPQKLGDSIRQLLGARGGSQIWTSSTPFVPPRYLKRRGRNTLEGQVLSELSCRGLPEARVEILPLTGQNNRLRHFKRTRARGGVAPPLDVGFALRLEFAEPIQGLLCLGYASHFGMGSFVADLQA